MMNEFHTLSECDTLGDVVDILLAGSQQDFPVVSYTHIVGVPSGPNAIPAALVIPSVPAATNSSMNAPVVPS